MKGQRELLNFPSHSHSPPAGTPWSCSCCSCILRGAAPLCRLTAALQLVPKHFPDDWHCDSTQVHRNSHLCPYHFLLLPTKELLLQKTSMAGEGWMRHPHKLISSFCCFFKVHHILQSTAHPSKYFLQFPVSK